MYKFQIKEEYANQRTPLLFETHTSVLEAKYIRILKK